MTSATQASGGYLSRAHAAARLGDPGRARSDLALASKYEPTATTLYHPAGRVDRAEGQAGDEETAA